MCSHTDATGNRTLNKENKKNGNQQHIAASITGFYHYMNRRELLMNLQSVCSQALRSPLLHGLQEFNKLSSWEHLQRKPL